MAGGRLGSRWLGLPIALAILPCAWSAGAHAATESGSCTAVARIVSIQGTLQVRRAGQTAFSYIRKLDTTLCQGDLLHTDAGSRAALLIIPETLLRLDQNSTITISQTADETVVEFTLDTGLPSPIVTTPNPCGAGYFITRFPRRFRVLTPFLNASVEGTEFLIAMRSESAQVAVFEGRVRAQQTLVGASQAVTLNDGESFAAGGTEPAAVKVLVKPIDAVQWALYYPPLSEPGPGVGPDQKCDQASAGERGRCLTERAEQRLRIGRVDDARADVEASLALAPRNADADALYSIISVVKNEKQNALALAQRATQADPLNPRAWIALSYAQQASFKLEDALHSAERATDLNPRSSTAQARAAELLMSLGRIKTAERAARAAVDASPNESRAHTILGFVHLAQIDTKKAREDFLSAIERDSSDPLPRLGLGLAIIRDGDLKAGREQIEIAVALDPTNSLIRSYVGKAYYEENTKERDKLAVTQFGIAKKLDPKDPTPWFYDAILKQTQNRPVEALDEVQKSIELNDNRAVSRSRLLLDDDSAARSASISAIYGELGFEKLEIVEGAKALAANYANSSAHRLLASAYSDLPRHDIARVSEVLQAQLRQPRSLPWLDPLLSNASLAILNRNSLFRTGDDDFNSLYDRNQLELQADFLGGDFGTLADRIVVSGLGDRLSFALGQLHYKTDGPLENTSAERNVYELALIGQPSYDSSLQLNVRHSELSLGQTFYAFDPSSVFPQITSDRSDSARVSGRYVIGDLTDVVVSLAHEDRTQVSETFPDEFVFIEDDSKTSSAEVQHLRTFDKGQVILGIGYVENHQFFGLFGESTIDINATNAYLYSHLKPWNRSLTLELGLSADSFELRNSLFDTPVKRELLNPKLGIVWAPTLSTTIRSAAFSSVKRPLVDSQTIEPTQVAGFNQFFTGFDRFFGDRDGTISRRVGVGLDHHFVPGTSAGIEASYRELEVPSLTIRSDVDWRESAGHAYLYSTSLLAFAKRLFPQWTMAAGIEYEYEKLSRPQLLTGPEGIMDVTTTRLPLAVNAYSKTGVSLRLSTTHIQQSGLFAVDVGQPTFPQQDSGWVTNLSIQYKLPRRRGTISLGVNNLFNESIALFDTDPTNPRVVTKRFVFCKVSLTI